MVSEWHWDDGIGRADREPAVALELLVPLAEDHPPEMTIDVLTLLATSYLELGRSGDAVELLREKAGGHPKLALTPARTLPCTPWRPHSNVRIS